MQGYISTTLRNWFQNENGTYEEFKKKYALCKWSKTILTEEMFDYIKTDPPKVYKSSDQKRKAQEWDKEQYHREKKIETAKPEKRKYVRSAPYTPPARQRMYKPIWTVEKTKIGESGFNALKEFIENLVAMKKAHFEIVEYANDIVEVREYN